MPPIETLGDALPKEMARVRDEVLPIYLVTPMGQLAAAMMRADLDRAARALAEGDVAKMIEVFESLKGWKV